MIVNLRVDPCFVSSSNNDDMLILIFIYPIHDRNHIEFGVHCSRDMHHAPANIDTIWKFRELIQQVVNIGKVRIIARNLKSSSGRLISSSSPVGSSHCPVHVRVFIIFRVFWITSSSSVYSSDLSSLSSPTSLALSRTSSGQSLSSSVSF